MLVIGFAVLGYAVAGAAAAQSGAHLSQDARVNAARALLHDGNPLPALDILRPLAKTERDDITDIRFLIALAAIRAATRLADGAHRHAFLDEAIASLRAILARRPGLLRVRLELARAFFLRGDDDLARRHFALALGAEPPPAVVANVNRFLYAMRERRRWSGYFSLNLEQTDNFHNQSDADVIYLFGLPFQTRDFEPQSETGVAFTGGAEYQFPLATSGWRWRFGGDAGRNEYEGGALDQTFVQVRSGPKYQFAERSQAGLQAVFGRRWLAGSRLNRNAALRLDARHQIAAKVSVNGTLVYTEVRAADTGDNDYDERTVSVGGAYLFTPLLQGNASIGGGRRDGEVIGNAARTGNNSRERNAAVGGALILSRGWTVGGEVEWSVRRFDNVSRRDRRTTAKLFILNRQFTIKGFSPQLVITNEQQKSNNAVREYKTTRADLRLVKQF